MNSKGELLLYCSEISKETPTVVHVFGEVVENACFLIFGFCVWLGIKFFPKEGVFDL